MATSKPIGTTQPATPRPTPAQANGGSPPPKPVYTDYASI